MCVWMNSPNFSKFLWTNFLRDKSEAFEAFEELWVKLAKEHNHKLFKIIRIRSDHGKEFENFLFRIFCSRNNIEHEFSV